VAHLYSPKFPAFPWPGFKNAEIPAEPPPGCFLFGFHSIAWTGHLVQRGHPRGPRGPARRVGDNFPQRAFLTQPSGSVLHRQLGGLCRKSRHSQSGLRNFRRFWYSDPHLPGWFQPQTEGALAHRILRPTTTLANRRLFVMFVGHMYRHQLRDRPIRSGRFWRLTIRLRAHRSSGRAWCRSIRAFIDTINNSLHFQLGPLPLLRFGVINQPGGSAHVCALPSYAFIAPRYYTTAGSALHPPPVHRHLPDLSAVAFAHGAISFHP